jgi:hypothetical protein
MLTAVTKHGQIIEHLELKSLLDCQTEKTPSSFVDEIPSRRMAWDQSCRGVSFTIQGPFE